MEKLGPRISRINPGSKNSNLPPKKSIFTIYRLSQRQAIKMIKVLGYLFPGKQCYNSRSRLYRLVKKRRSTTGWTPMMR